MLLPMFTSWQWYLCPICYQPSSELWDRVIQHFIDCLKETEAHNEALKHEVLSLLHNAERLINVAILAKAQGENLLQAHFQNLVAFGHVTNLPALVNIYRWNIEDAVFDALYSLEQAHDNADHAYHLAIQATFGLFD